MVLARGVFADIFPERPVFLLLPTCWHKRGTLLVFYLRRCGRQAHCDGSSQGSSLGLVYDMLVVFNVLLFWEVTVMNGLCLRNCGLAYRPIFTKISKYVSITKFTTESLPFSHTF